MIRFMYLDLMTKMLKSPTDALPFNGFPVRMCRRCQLSCRTQAWQHSQELFCPAHNFHSTYETVPIRVKPTQQFLCSYWFRLRSPYRQWSFSLSYVGPDLSQAACSACLLLLANFSISLFFDYEDGGHMFLRNIELFSTNTTL
jgi:hypothetical protein